MNTLQKSLILIDELFASSNKEELKQEIYSYDSQVFQREPKLKDFRVNTLATELLYIIKPSNGTNYSQKFSNSYKEYSSLESAA